MSDLAIRHLHRELQTALELAIVALAPRPLVDGLGLAAGLLGAIVELPAGSAPVVALVPRVSDAAKRAMADWHAWEKEHLPKATA